MEEEEEEEVRARMKRATRLIRDSWFPPSNPSLSQLQAISRRNKPAKGPLWVCQTSLPIINDGELRRAFLHAVHEIGGGDATFTLSRTESVAIEWDGYRRSKENPSPNLSPQAIYNNLHNDMTNNLTILFIHGGGFVTGNPSTNRMVPASLAKLTGGRICQVDYRMAPQNAFPAALYDIFLAYLSLLSPPAPPTSGEASLQSPTPTSANSIVLAGESSGGNLSLSLLHLLLHFHRKGTTHLPFNNTLTPLHLPAGIAVLCSYVDQTESLPSWHTTRHVDYTGQRAFYLAPTFPRDHIWPTTPERYSPYCDGMALCHPLVSPAAVRDWSGAPRMWLACGEESVRDGNVVIARQAARQGVKVRWEEHVGMPHIFPLLPGLENIPQVKRCLRSWADFVKDCVKANGVGEGISGVRIGYDGNVVDEIDVVNMSPDLDFNEAQRRMRQGMMRHEELMKTRQCGKVKL